MSLADVYREIPPVIGNRFRYLRPFVRELIYPTEEYESRLRSLPSSGARKELRNEVRLHIENATLLALVFSLMRLFEEGHRAAVMAVDEFEQVGVSQFRIGNLMFSDRNENVMLGKVLGDALLENIQDTGVRQLILNSKTVSELVRTYKSQYADQ